MTVGAGGHAASAKVCGASFQRVLSNILNNAIESIRDSELVALRIAQMHADVVLTVGDTGIGIPEALLEQLGKRGVAQQKDGGHGLGLSHAIEAAKGWGSKLAIHRKVGEGTQIEVILPAADPPAQFAQSLNLGPKETLVVRQTKPATRAMWQERVGKVLARVVCLPDAAALRAYVRKKSTAVGERFVIDLALHHPQDNGLGLIEDLDLADRAFLATDDFSKDLSDRGFSQLFLTTGHLAESLQPTP